MPRNPWFRTGFYAWSLGLEASSVIALRTLKIAARGVAAEETECCSFFNFQFSAVGSDILMSIEVPTSRVAVLDSLAARISNRSGRAPSSQ